MANLQLKDIPDEMHAELRRRAERKGITLRSYVLRLIERDLERMPQDEWFEQVRSREPVAGVSAADALREAREERDRELLGRLGL